MAPQPERLSGETTFASGQNSFLWLSWPDPELIGALNGAEVFSRPKSHRTILGSLQLLVGAGRRPKNDAGTDSRAVDSPRGPMVILC